LWRRWCTRQVQDRKVDNKDFLVLLDLLKKTQDDVYQLADRVWREDSASASFDLTPCSITPTPRDALRSRSKSLEASPQAASRSTQQDTGEVITLQSSPSLLSGRTELTSLADKIHQKQLDADNAGRQVLDSQFEKTLNMAEGMVDQIERARVAFHINASLEKVMRRVSDLQSTEAPQ